MYELVCCRELARCSVIGVTADCRFMKYTRLSDNPRFRHGSAVSLPMISVYLTYVKTAVKLL
ncbi:hypothetical protein Osc7112_6504 (plasmid) [Oscillatoria nigro-viridis PCC 7112]|uniref:Uncharacterized protein n=1 Tax=Phormidium nigroviride PCC 7112 TaxID=179408 RepID=K9VRU0_9CYAN|nr:hypothetical protein Osc7112_6504 [Oscillatoria nigro-viridis PCC 7112]